MTRVALPIWSGRLSPVFDVAEHLLLVDLDGPREVGRQVRGLSDPEPLARAHVLSGLDVDVLICGAVSRTMEHALASSGVDVVSGICGDVERVLLAYSRRTLEDEPALHLPGSRRGTRTPDDPVGRRVGQPGGAR
jgi:predicted Fe-Mo cluster-binding NifX family protein